MRVLVTGSRDLKDFEKVSKTLEALKPELIIQGGARGADKLADDYAVANGIPCIEMKANWTYYGKPAGSIRNRWMRDFCNPDIVIAFPLPESIGTWNMVKLAKDVGIKVEIYE